MTVFGAEITDRKQAELLLVEQNRLLEAIASGQPLDDCLSALCASVASLNPGGRACFLLTDTGRRTFKRSITPDFPPSFGTGLKDAPINDLCIGTCGEAVYRGQPISCADIANDDRWSQGWRDLCIAHGILACHSQPVMGIDDFPLASLMLCFSEARKPTEWEYQLVDFGTQVASIAFERERSLQARRESEEKFRLASEGGNFGWWYWDLETDTLTLTDKAKAMFGLPTNTVMSMQVFLEAVHPDDRPFVQTVLTEIQANQAHTEIEYRTLWADGTIRWILGKGDCAYNPDGAIISTQGLLIDISDRKLAEATLRESEERFRLMADAAPVLIWVADTDKLCYYFNLPWLNFTGRTMEQEMGNGWTQGVHPDDFQRCLDTYVTAFEARQPFQMEYRLKRFDGIYRWIIDEAVPRYTSAGQFLGYIGSCIDIEDRKQAEEALRESEIRLRLILESAKDYAIFTVDLNGIIASWNSGAEGLLGYSEAEAIGCPCRMIFTPEDNEQGRAETEMQIALTQGRAENERWHLCKDGSRFWGSGLMMPLLNGADHAQGFVKILQDKTVQRQASERLQLLYETTRDLLSTEQPLALMQALFRKLSVQLDLHSYYNFIVEEKDHRRILHLRNYEGISQETAEAIEWIEFGEYLCGLVAQTQQQLVLNQAQLSTHPHAQAICLMGVTAYAGQPLIAQGQLLGTLSFASLTRTHFTPAEIELLQSTCDQMAIALDRANLTASLQQQTEQLKQTNRIKDEFLAVLSHELRSPLNPILGWSKLLQSRKLNETKTAQALATIERNAKLQSELIEDLLDVSRILQGKLSLNIHPVDLALTVEAAIETVSLAAIAKGIEIQTRLDSQMGPVLGDSSRLQQVVWNLVSNAVKFSPAGGRVEVRLTGVGDWAKITVTDTGIGINPEFLPYVFDYFRQEDGATTRKFGGLGLGLAIVRHLVELHGGTVQADSLGEGQGATFTVRLPLSGTVQGPENSLAELSESLSPDEPLWGVRVLVVDDEPDMRELASFLLEQAGATVTTVTTALEALTAFAQFQPDVLLSDIGMADMDGYMLLQQVRALPPERGGQVLAIALTAYAGEWDRKQALQAGFEEHLAKPIDPEILVSVIARLCGRNGGIGS